MDLAQLAQMVNWLDEEHRRDRAEIARLQQRIESQSADIIEQARRIQELEGRLAGTQAQLGKFTQLENALQNTKTEIAALVNRNEDDRTQAQRDLERARLSDRELLSREISEVRRELPRIGRLEEAIDLRAAEDDRLSELVMAVRNQLGGLAKEIEERTRQIPFLSEQRSSDTKRIAQLQQETVELFRRIEAVSGRIPILEESVRKTSVELEKIQPTVDILRDEQHEFMEEIRVTTSEQAQAIQRWRDSIAEQKTMVTQAYERVQSFAQQVDIARRSVSEIQEFKDLILREQSQVQELQRLAEERIRREMDEFREDFEKKRRKAELRQEHLWGEQDKYNREVTEKFPPLLHDLKAHDMLIEHMWKLQESYGNYFLGIAQSWIDGMQTSLRERDDKVRSLEEDWQRQRRNAEIYASQTGQRRTSGVVSGETPTSNGQSRK